MNIALTKLPNPVRLEWNRYVLEKTIIQPSLNALAEWLLNYAKACRDLPTNSNFPSSQNIGVHKMAWKTSHSTRINENPNPKHQFLSNREQGQIQSKTKESVSCPNNDNCQYLYKCIHFQALSPLKRRDHVMKQKLCFNCFRHHHVDQCNSKNFCRSKGCGKRHNTLLHDSFMNKSNSNVKPVQFV